MNKVIVMVAIAVVAAVGISSFALMSNNAGEISPVVQEPMIEKPAVLEEKVSVLDTTNPFSAPITIAQSMKGSQQHQM